MDKRTTLELHVATQYLAAAAKMYLPPKADDSHTNLGWNPNASSFFSRTFPNRDTLVFYTKRMTLEWKGTMKESFAIDGHKHTDVVQWLETVSRKNGVKKFEFDLHYTLDSGSIPDDFCFGQTTAESLDNHANYRTMSTRACKSVLSELGLNGEVRTWPHHFDTGAYVLLPKTEQGIGIGLAIPGDLVNDYYLYAAGYNHNDGVSTKSLPGLSKGKWINSEWKGAICQVVGMKESEYCDFLKEAVGLILNRT